MQEPDTLLQNVWGPEHQHGENTFAGATGGARRATATSHTRSHIVLHLLVLGKAARATKEAQVHGGDAS
jgi:hypothetical protein